MINEELPPLEQIAALNEERRLMEKLVESPGWAHLVELVTESILVLQSRGDRVFLQTTFGEDKLDGIQSLVYEGYSKGIRAGMQQILSVPPNLISHNRDAAMLLERKLALEEDNDDGSSTDDTDSSSLGSIEPESDFDFDSTSHRSP
jgi:hypothetical protein